MPLEVEEIEEAVRKALEVRKKRNFVELSLIHISEPTRPY